MSLAIPVDQPPEDGGALAEACRSCGGEGRVKGAPLPYVYHLGTWWIVCDHCDGTGDEPAEAPCAL